MYSFLPGFFQYNMLKMIHSVAYIMFHFTFSSAVCESSSPHITTKSVGQ